MDVLAHNGFEVVIPRGQGCCGALHAHAGDQAFAHALARRNAEEFARAGVREVVVNSAGCGAAMRDAGRWLGAEGEALAAGAIDVSAFLAREGLRGELGRIQARVCYDDPCHLVHGQRVSDSAAAAAGADPRARARFRTTIRPAVVARPESTISRTGPCRRRCSRAS